MIAKIPAGANRTTKRATRDSAPEIVESPSMIDCFSLIPMSATPRPSENTTVAGTTPVASELNGFAGMKRLTRFNSGAGSTRLVLKYEAASQSG